MIAIHAATNTTVGLLPVLPDAADSLIPLWTAISIAAVVALLLIVRTQVDSGTARALSHQVV